jgi:SAM-dependent methyltransferase
VLNLTISPFIVTIQIAKAWNTYFTPPSRISPDEARKYGQWFKENRGKTACVLGVTPEIREHLTKLGYQTTCIDINREMICAMDSILKVKNPTERVLNENWLDNSLDDDSFDLVIGDAILPNVAWEERSVLLSEIKRIMKPDGLFITRAFCMPHKKPFSNIEEILKHFSKKEPGYRSALEFTLEIQILFYDSVDHIGSFLRSKEVLEKYRKRDGFHFESSNLNKILDMVWNFWCKVFVDKKYYYAYVDVEEEQYKEFFRILKTYRAKDNQYSDITPMYIMGQK